MTTRILVVDDFAPWRAAVRSILEAILSFLVIGEARDGIEAIEQVATLRPDVVLLDIGMPRLNGIEAAKNIKQAYPESKIIFLTQENNNDVQNVVTLDTGAAAYLLKSTAASELLGAIERATLHGRPNLQPHHREHPSPRLCNSLEVR